MCLSDFSILSKSGKSEKYYAKGKVIVDLNAVDSLEFSDGDIKIANAYPKNGISFHSENKNILVLSLSDREWQLKHKNPTNKKSARCILE
jgi:hypothetical protein